MRTAETAGPVVVGIDGSTAALDAVRWAAEEAAQRGVPLRIVYVAPDHDPDPVFGAPDIDRDYGDDALLQASAAAIETHHYPIVVPVFRRGDPTASLRNEGGTASLLVVGSVGIGIIGAVLLGSTAAALAATAPCPVAIVKSPHIGHPNAQNTASQPIVAVLTGLPSEWDAIIARATTEAAIRHTTVLVASVQTDETDDKAIETRIAGWQEQRPGIRMDSISESGQLPSFAASLAKIAQIIVVGPPEHDRSRGVGMTGRVTHVLLRESDSPVLIVRGHGLLHTFEPEVLDVPPRQPTISSGSTPNR